MKYTFAIFISFFIACITPFLLRHFAHYVNQQVEQNYLELFKISNDNLVGLSEKSLPLWVGLIYPLLLLTFALTTKTTFSHFVLFTLILALLIYLSLLDYTYYLTDVRFIFILFILSLAEGLFFNFQFLEERIFSLFITSIFFSLFPLIVQCCLNKEGFGQGDAILLYAIAPLFNLTQMLSLLLCASVTGCIYAFIKQFIFKQKIEKMPFIPFITFSTWLMIIQFY